MAYLSEYKLLYPNLALIPDDILIYYDLETEFSAYQLHRLFDVVGLKIITEWAQRQASKYPDKPLFVSTLRKRYKHRLPRDFYGSKSSQWVVYLLVALGHRHAKIGVSSAPAKRAEMLSGINPKQTRPKIMQFDLDQSLILSGFTNKCQATKTEKNLLFITQNQANLAPSWAPYQHGSSEWRSYSQALDNEFEKASKDLCLNLTKASCFFADNLETSLLKLLIDS